MRRKGAIYDHDIIELCAYIALCISGLLLLVNYVLGVFKTDLGTIQRLLMLVRDIAFIAGVGLAALKFTRGKSVVIKIIFWVAIVAYLVFAILNIL